MGSRHAISASGPVEIGACDFGEHPESEIVAARINRTGNPAVQRQKPEIHAGHHQVLTAALTSDPYGSPDPPPSPSMRFDLLQVMMGTGCSTDGKNRIINNGLVKNRNFW